MSIVLALACNRAPQLTSVGYATWYTRHMGSEKLPTWLSVTNAHIELRPDGQEVIKGYFELAMQIPEGQATSIALQSLRRRMVAYEIFGENPPLGMRRYTSAPKFVGNSMPGATWLHYRAVKRADIPQGPEIISVSEGDHNESI